MKNTGMYDVEKLLEIVHRIQKWIKSYMTLFHYILKKSGHLKLADEAVTWISYRNDQVMAKKGLV